MCNDVGGWGRGFVLAISKRWEAPEKEYRAWAASGENFSLGEVQFVQVEPEVWVANMIGQRDVKRDKNGEPPVRYPAIKNGLEKVGWYICGTNTGNGTHARIGRGLAGGTWYQIEPLIKDALTSKGIQTVVYDFE